MYREAIETFFESHREEFLRDLSYLVSIDSSRGEALKGKPYGQGPARALEAALQLAQGYGMYTENWENYVGIVQLSAGESRALDIMAHLDVVEGGEGWSVTDPFTMKEKDGRVYGRGTADDKGPALAALYALRAVKELNIPLTHPVRLMLGCDEECGSSDLDYYFSRTQPAPMTFSPDADYPVIHIEKGLYYGSFKAEAPAGDRLPRVLSIHSGDKGNVIPAKAKAVIQGLTPAQVVKAAEEMSHAAGAAFSAEEGADGVIEITAEGLSAHASSPEKGNNAATAMLQLLCGLPMAQGAFFEKLCGLQKLFPHGDFYGKAAGMYVEDELSGSITVSLNILDYDGATLEATFDSRTPVSADPKTLKRISEKADRLGFSFKDQYSPAHHVPRDSAFVQTLLKHYADYTGKVEAPIAIGGGTYVHGIENGVAFGCAVKETDNRMHGPDEFAEIDMLLMSGKLFTSVIAELCSVQLQQGAK